MKQTFTITAYLVADTVGPVACGDAVAFVRRTAS